MQSDEHSGGPEQAGSAQERVFTPSTAVSGEGEAEAVLTLEEERPNETDPVFDTPIFVGTASLPDTVPLPNPQRIELRDGAETIVARESGDPYFLGFSSGKHYPPADEILDPLLVQAMGALGFDARPDRMTYAFVMFSKRITEERLDELRQAGCRVLGFHPHYTIKVAVPGDSIGEISTLDFVRWIGVSRKAQKLHAAMAGALDGALPGESIRVYVSTFEEDAMDAAVDAPFGSAETLSADGTKQVVAGLRAVRWQSNGWMHRALEAAGANVISYARGYAAFEVEIPAELVDGLLDYDFVQFVEPIPDSDLTAMPHETSRAMVSSDRIRPAHDGGTN